MILPLYNLNLTSPVTYSCVDSTKAWIASRSGVNHFPSYTTWASLLPISFLTSIVARSRQSSSSWSCASMRIVPPGVSYTPRDFIPTTRFSTISMMPMPCLPPRRLSSLMMSATFIFLPLTDVGTPFSNVIVTYSPSSGACSGVTLNTSRWS